MGVVVVVVIVVVVVDVVVVVMDVGGVLALVTNALTSDVFLPLLTSRVT